MCRLVLVLVAVVALVEGLKIAPTKPAAGLNEAAAQPSKSDKQWDPTLIDAFLVDHFDKIKATSDPELSFFQASMSVEATGSKDAAKFTPSYAKGPFWTTDHVAAPRFASDDYFAQPARAHPALMPVYYRPSAAYYQPQPMYAYPPRGYYAYAAPGQQAQAPPAAAEARFAETKASTATEASTKASATSEATAEAATAAQATAAQGVNPMQGMQGTANVPGNMMMMGANNAGFDYPAAYGMSTSPMYGGMYGSMGAGMGGGMNSPQVYYSPFAHTFGPQAPPPPPMPVWLPRPPYVTPPLPA